MVLPLEMDRPIPSKHGSVVISPAAAIAPSRRGAPRQGGALPIESARVLAVQLPRSEPVERAVFRLQVFDERLARRRLARHVLHELLRPEEHPALVHLVPEPLAERPELALGEPGIEPELLLRLREELSCIAISERVGRK